MGFISKIKDKIDLSEDKKFYISLLKHIRKECPDVKLIYGGKNVYNCYLGIGFVTLFRSKENSCIGVSWKIKNHYKEFFCIVATKSFSFPKGVKIGNQIEGSLLTSIKSINDIYDKSSEEEQIKFLSEQFISLYIYVNKLIGYINRLASSM